MRRSLAWVGALAWIGVGCGGGGGHSCPGAVDISGLWNGTVTHDDVAQSSPGTVSASITEANCELGGTWTFSFGDALLDKTLQIGGGAPETSAVTMNLQECEVGLLGSCQTLNPCTFVVNATLVSPTEMSGSYATNDRCSESEAGTFDIVFQAKLTPTPVPTTVVLPTPVPTATPTR